MTDWSKPAKVDKLTVVFGPKNIDELLPTYEETPAEFKRINNPWVEVISTWFYSGLPKDTKIEAKEGIDAAAAVGHIKACLGSFEPAHERKTAGCAYLLSLWFNQFGTAAHKGKV